MARKLNKPTVTPPIDTGIYRIPGDRWAGVETHTSEALAAVAESIAKSWHFPTLAEETQRIMGNVRIGKADSRSHVQKAAQDLATAVWCLRTAVADGHVQAVAIYGIQVGTLDEELRIKLGPEYIVKQRKDTTAKLRAGAGTLCHPDETRIAALKRFAQLQRDNPTRKLGAISSQVSQEFQVPERTLDEWRRKDKAKENFSQRS